MAPRDRRSTERVPSSDCRYSRAEFARDFPDDDACLSWLKDERYPDGIFCKNCERVTTHHRVKSRPSYSCQFCGHHVHPTAGTVFHKSSTSLHLWFQGIFLMSATRCGISAKQLEREIGVNYKTALRMFHQIRALLGMDEIGPLTGDVEIDETFLTRSKRNRPWEQRRHGSGPTLGERVIMGSVERGGRIVARHVPRATKVEADKHAALYVLPAAHVFTDESLIYNGLETRQQAHHRVKHSARVYVDGDAHTQTIEGFWSLFKRGLTTSTSSATTTGSTACLCSGRFWLRCLGGCLRLRFRFLWSGRFPEVAEEAFTVRTGLRLGPILPRGLRVLHAIAAGNTSSAGHGTPAGSRPSFDADCHSSSRQTHTIKKSLPVVTPDRARRGRRSFRAVTMVTGSPGLIESMGRTSKPLSVEAHAPPLRSALQI
jgi:transposase